MQKSFFSYYEFSTPLGQMIAICSEEKLCLLDFTDSKHVQSNMLKLSKNYNVSYVNSCNNIVKQVICQIEEYFVGKRLVFDIPINYTGSLFQQKVLHALEQIPYGQVITYKQQAESLEMPSSIRAVANANSKNLIAIIIPCHRVIGSNGKLTGYAGGLERKKYLLDLERNH
jgi:AraC family transcriptional regulator of adaptative response/methylated-DNA-[protein]-cysteine methyltransferase